MLFQGEIIPLGKDNITVGCHTVPLMHEPFCWDHIEEAGTSVEYQRKDVCCSQKLFFPLQLPGTRADVSEACHFRRS